jgi:acetoin utilization deacetylase AcuC-like enzyme
MTTALIADDRFLDHETGADHPESPERLRAVMRGLDERGLLERPEIRRLEPRPATDDELAAVHSRSYIAGIDGVTGKIQPGQLARLDPDTYMGLRSAEVARLAAGAALVGIDAVVAGDARNAVALVRPPGHHAEYNEAMGFCLFNNVAVAARYAQRHHSIGKVLIVDYDVHHGNGTQHTFYDDPSVAYFSTHQAPFYPGTGAYDEIGEDDARFTTCNAPVPAQSQFTLFDAIFREVLFPFADRFKPDLVLLSAGFDAHWRDPIADILLDADSFRALTKYVMDLADIYSGGRLVAVLEGGYDLEALAQCAGDLVASFAGLPLDPDPVGPAPSPGFRWNEEAVVGQLRAVQELVGFRRIPRLPGPEPT